MEVSLHINLTCTYINTEEKDFRMLVKAVHEVFAKWENIGVCLSIPAQIMDNLGHKWRSKLCHSVTMVISIISPSPMNIRALKVNY